MGKELFPSLSATPTDEEEDIVVSNPLETELEKDIFHNLSSYKDQDTYHYVSQLARVVANDSADKGYITFIINFKHLNESLQVILGKSKGYYKFLDAARKVFIYMLTLYEQDYVESMLEDDLKNTPFNDIIKAMPQIIVRIKNFNYDLDVQDISDVKSIKSLGAKSYDKLTVVKGLTISAVNKDQHVVRIDMRCSNLECGHDQSIIFYELDALGKAGKCSVCEEGHMIVFNTEVSDVQIVTLEDYSEPDKIESPVTMKCVLSHDLVDTIAVGDNVIATGILKFDIHNNNSKRQYNDMTKTNNDYYRQMANYRALNMGISYPSLYEINFIEVNTIDDCSNFETRIDEIKELQKKANLYDLIIQSYCPHVKGHYDIKESIVLTLVGGVGRYNSKLIDKRGNMRTLIIADPSVAKSEIMKYTAAIMKGAYATAVSSSKVGLTASVRMDETLGKPIIEAGAMLRANGSVICIDEISKLPPDVQEGLYEVMEQETLTINKYGISKTYKVNIAIISGGNPRDGRFNPELSVAQNLSELAYPFLSRNDRKHTLRDIPDKEKDKDIARHVINLYNGDTSYMNGLIPFDLLSAFLQYVRKYGTEPKINDEAAEYLASQYATKRQEGDPDDLDKPITITVREHEGIIRSCQAKARLLGLEEVGIDIAKDVYEKFAKMMKVVTYNPQTGKEDISGVENKSRTEVAKDMQLFEMLKKMVEEYEDNVLEQNTIISRAVGNGMKESSVIRLLGQYERSGLVSQKGYDWVIHDQGKLT